MRPLLEECVLDDTIVSQFLVPTTLGTQQSLTHVIEYWNRITSHEF